MNGTALYHRLPVILQNLAVSAYGARVRRQRYGRVFDLLVDQLIHNEALSADEVLDLQSQLLGEVIRRAYRDVPYYREAWRGTCVDSPGLTPQDVLADLPTVDKATIRRSSPRFVSDVFGADRLIDYPTGGTSGSALILRYTLDQIRYNFAFGEARIRHWAGTRLGVRTATFLGKQIVAPEQRRPPYWRFDRPQNQVLFSIFHLNPHTAESYIRALEDTAPEIIVGYVSPIVSLAKFVIQRGGVSFAPKLVWTSSETLFPEQRAMIEKAFSCRVNNAYSAAECVTFISQCPHGCMHISPEFGYTELKPIGEGSGLYEIIGTTLFNHSMPLIRYETGDMVTLGKPNPGCTLPFPVVGEVLGRVDDLIVTPEGTLVGGAPLSLVFSTTEEVLEAQLVQKATDEVQVRLVPAPGREVTHQTLDRIEAGLRGRLGDKVGFTFEVVGRIPRTAGGKFKFIQSELPRSLMGTASKWPEDGDNGD